MTFQRWGFTALHVPVLVFYCPLRQGRRTYFSKPESLAELKEALRSNPSPPPWYFVQSCAHSKGFFDPQGSRMLKAFFRDLSSAIFLSVPGEELPKNCTKGPGTIAVL